MIGLMIFIFVPVAYLYIAYKVVQLVVQKTQKKVYWILTAGFFILIPTWDVIIGKVYLHFLCKTEGGLKVYETVNADGFLDTHISFDDNPSSFDINQAKEFLDYGFQFYEVPTYKGKTLHFKKDSNGRVTFKVLTKAESRYVYFGYPTTYISTENEYIPWLHIKKSEQGFRDLQTSKIVVQNTIYHRIGWFILMLEETIGSTSPHYEQCGNMTYDSKLQYQILKGNFHE